MARPSVSLHMVADIQGSCEATTVESPAITTSISSVVTPEIYGTQEPGHCVFRQQSASTTMPLNVKGRLGLTYSNLDRHREEEKDNHRMYI